MLGLSRLTVHSVKTTRTLFPVKNYIFGTTYTTAARWYNSRRNDKFKKQATSEVCKKSNYIKFGPPPECFSPPPPPPPNASKLKYLLGAALLATGGLGLAYYFKFFQKDDEVEKPKTEEVKVVEQPLAPVVEKRERRLRRPVPETSAEIPKEIPYLLIGGGTASFAASRAIKGHDAKAKVMIITNETDLPYMRPPLSKEVWYNKDGDDPLKFRQWNGNERSLYFEPDDFFIDPKKLPELENGGVTVVRGYGVTKIDVAEGKAILTDGTEIKYGKCLIATGAKPKNLDIFESAPLAIKERLTLFRSIEDYEHLKDSLRGKSKVAVIGGGFLGTEISCALTKYAEVNNQPLEIVQVFYEDANLGRVLPQYLSNWTMDRVREEGVTVIPKTQVQGVSLHNQQIKLTLLNNSSILVDHIVVAVGSEANTDLAKTSNLEVDPILGGFLVNAELMARSNLYVAGDAACFYDPKLGRRRIEHHDHAVVSGRLAGENMVGMHKPYTHQSMFWSDLGPVIGFEGIGIVDSSLPTVGIFAKQTPEDTPQADKTDKLQAGEPIKSENSQSLPAECKPGNPKCEEDFSKGVIFYLKDEKVVGVLLWNVFNRINTARKIVVQNTKYEDLNELAKLFNLHGSYSSEE